MRTLDHIGFAVPTPGGAMEFSGAAAGFGRDDAERPSFFIEAHGEPVRGRLHMALAAETRAQADAFHSAAVEAGA